MQFCESHWDKLKTAINEQGLEHLCAKSTEELATKLTDGEETNLDNFDPLFAAHIGIVGHLIEKDPTIMLHPGCPLCLVAKRCSCPDKETDPCDLKWIRFASEGVKGEVEKMRDEEFPTTVEEKI